MTKKKSDDNVDVDEPNFEDPDDFVDDVSDQGEMQSKPHCNVRLCACVCVRVWMCPAVENFRK